MKNLILSIPILFLCCCSPQRQFARLIRKYPELQASDSILKFTENIIIPSDSAEVRFLARDFSQIKGEINIETPKSKAVLTRLNDTIYSLKTILKTDTVTITKHIEVPTYYTKTQTIIKEVDAPLKRWQKSLITCGILTLLLLISTIITKIYKFFKP